MSFSPGRNFFFSIWAIPSSPESDAKATSPTLTVADKEEEDSGLIDFNLKGTKIDQVIEFISKHTGKPVYKAKSVSAEITIATPEKSAPSR